MAFDAFLKFSDTKLAGESTDTGHPGEIALVNWSWSGQNTATIGSSTTGAGAGKVQFNEFSFTKVMDKASAPLFAALCQGSHCDTAIISLRKGSGADAGGLDYMKITLALVYVTSYSTGTSGDEVAHENITLSFGAMKMEYQPQDAKGGKAGGVISSSWSRIKNNNTMAVA